MIELENAIVYHGSNLDVLPTLPDNSVDSIVTDPPYELGFMGKSWDSSGIAYSVELWQECMRVLKPGGHLLAFSGSRTYHRMVVAIEDAGFEIRDMISWISNKTFPKSHNVALGIDKLMGHENRGRAIPVASKYQASDVEEKNKLISNPVDPYTGKSSESAKWQGWGTGLKPTVEPIVMARKPLIGTVAQNVLTYGTGGLNIDASRIGMTAEDEKKSANNWKPQGYEAKENIYDIGNKVLASEQNSQGRWPANIILDPYTAELLDEQSGFSKSTGIINRWIDGAQPFGGGAGKPYESVQGVADSGGASRFFYVAKASKRDRNEGLEGLPEQVGAKQFNEGMEGQVRSNGTTIKPASPQSNFHPTVKPTSLMEYLIKLVTPEGGTVLDPFTGSGSTGKAALLNGFQFIGIELTEEYLPIIEGRLRWANQQRNQDASQSDKEEKETLF